MKRKASISKVCDPNQAPLAFAHDGEQLLTIIRVPELDSPFKIPSYGNVLVCGEDEKIIIYRLADDSIVCLMGNGNTKLGDWSGCKRGTKWCRNYSCIHISHICGPESSKFFSFEGKDPNTLSRLDCSKYGNIRRYVTNPTNPGFCEPLKPKIWFSIPKGYGGKEKRHVFKFPFRKEEYNQYRYTIWKGTYDVLLIPEVWKSVFHGEIIITDIFRIIYAFVKFLYKSDKLVTHLIEY